MKAFDEMYDELQNVQNSELGQLLEEAVQEKKKKVIFLKQKI